MKSMPRNPHLPFSQGGITVPVFICDEGALFTMLPADSIRLYPMTTCDHNAAMGYNKLPGTSFPGIFHLYQT
jgi:hypothetical protein